MKRWLPRFETHGWCGCDDADQTFEGRSLTIDWLGFMVEIVFARAVQS